MSRAKTRPSRYTHLPPCADLFRSAHESGIILFVQLETEWDTCPYRHRSAIHNGRRKDVLHCGGNGRIIEDFRVTLLNDGLLDLAFFVDERFHPYFALDACTTGNFR